jgi:hypothetical protein
MRISNVLTVFKEVIFAYRMVIFEPKNAWNIKVSDNKIVIKIFFECSRTFAFIILSPLVCLAALFRHSRKRLPPRLGEFIICLFVPPEKQEDRLADFEERFTSLWLPKFGARIARLIYLAQAIRSAGAIIRIGIITAVVDGVIRAIGK